MSDLAVGIPDGESLCVDLVDKLRHPELVIVSCATGILANLTANNETLKLAVCKAHGVPALVSLLDRVPLDNKDGRDIFESALSALKHLTNNHRGAEQVQHMFVFELNGLAILNRNLAPTTNRPGLKGILNVVNNLLLKNVENHEVIKKENLPRQIMLLLEWATQGIADSRGNVPIDGVKLTELIDASLRCAFSFSKETIYYDVMRDVKTVKLFKHILLFFAHEENKGPIENIVRLAAAVIEFISSSDLEGAYIIYQEGFDEAVIRLANHSNQKIAASASGIMHALANMKNQEQTGNFHPPRHLQRPHTQIQNPNLQNIPPPGGNGFGQGPIPNQQVGPAHMQPGGPGYHPRNQFPPLQQQSPMHANPGFDQMLADPAIHGSGPPGQSPQIPMGQRDPQKTGAGYNQMPGSQRGAPPQDSRMGGQPGYADDMSMEMGHMNVTSPQYNPNFSAQDFFEGNM